MKESGNKRKRKWRRRKASENGESGESNMAERQAAAYINGEIESVSLEMALMAK